MAYNILIVEDSKLINDNLKKSLESDGHYVEQAFDYVTAVGLIQSNRFEFILLDLILPDGEGEMLLPYAKRADTRVIVMTTDRDSFRRDRIFGFGIVDYIIKDRYFDDLIDGIRKMIRQVESNSTFTLLVVDDSAFIRNNLELLLISRGFLVLTAIDGKEAIAKMQEYPIDALISDLEMPTMDGFELMAKIRRKKEYRNLPVMILTGSNDSNKIAKVIKYDVKDLIRKPYITEEVLLKIDNMMNDVQQRRSIGEERRKFDLYHDAIVNSTLYMKISPDLKAIYINERFSQLLFGNTLEEFQPISLKEFVKNPTLDLFRSLQKLSPQNPPVYYIFMFNKFDGAPCYVSATVSGIFDAQGKMMEMVFIGHDITQLQQHELYLQEQVEKQMQINFEQQQLMFNQAKMAAMGEMIGNIAHQWRQPLNALGLMIQGIEDAHLHGELDEPYLHDMTVKSMTKIEFMSQTIDDFRNFFQPNKAKEPFDMAVAVHKTIDIIGKTLENHNIDLVLDGVEEGGFMIDGYRNELQQVILNLLNNAKDALCSNDGEGVGAEKWIHISIEEKKKMCVLSIEDNGGGIPESIIERIFEPYYTTKQEGKGTGVGLYMSKMIIEQNMGGRLEVSNHAQGACFSIYLPSLETQLAMENKNG
ncbi:MAG: response regulator [Sulfuricurvum sp.]|nr:response regulator [Sulfuricurvum sp.]